jgi:hypothetical protein
LKPGIAGDEMKRLGLFGEYGKFVAKPDRSARLGPPVIEDQRKRKEARFA